MKSIILIIILLLLIACQPKEANSDAIKQPAKESVKETDKKHPQDEVVFMPCTKEAKQCDNGKMVVRNPKNNCEFDPCEGKPVKKNNPVMCSTDEKQCPDGSFVGRDHYNNCRFKDCPNSDK